MRNKSLIIFILVFSLVASAMAGNGQKEEQDSTAQTQQSQSIEDTGSGQPSSSPVWKDSTTGLTWQVSPSGGMMKWQAAKAHCRALNLGGLSNWRLPTISELRSLIRGCPSSQKSGACGVMDSCLSYSCWHNKCGGCYSKNGPKPSKAFWPTELSGTISWYWSSSAVAGDINGAWHIGFFGGIVYYDSVGGSSFVRCVHKESG